MELIEILLSVIIVFLVLMDFYSGVRGKRLQDIMKSQLKCLENINNSLGEINTNLEVKHNFETSEAREKQYSIEDINACLNEITSELNSIASNTSTSYNK